MVFFFVLVATILVPDDAVFTPSKRMPKRFETDTIFATFSNSQIDSCCQVFFFFFFFNPIIESKKLISKIALSIAETFSIQFHSPDLNIDF
ncbi:hypothetical protein ACSBR1_043877 [Camellia fascicularis]